VGVVALFGVGIAIGTNVSTGSDPGASAPAIHMAQATPESCRAPNPTAAQTFRVTDTANTQYLLRWQVSPYDGPHSYELTPKDTFLALQPPAGGPPLGFGSGTLTFFYPGTLGSVDATVTLKAGGTVRVTGGWSCD